MTTLEVVEDVFEEGVGQGTAVADLTDGSAAAIINSVTVDASAGGTGQTTNLTLVPANSLLLAVCAEVVTPFDGDTTTTLEVGISGNADKYIDTSDFDPSGVAGTNYCNIGGTNNDQKTPEWIDSASQLIATWTNTASAAAGSVAIYAVYIPLKTTNLDTQFTALLDSLEGGKIIAD